MGVRASGEQVRAAGRHAAGRGAVPWPGAVRWWLRGGAWSTAVLVCSLAIVLWPGSAAAGTGSGGPWTWPMTGPPPVTRGFSPPEVRYGAGHRGVDLGAAPGAPVVAAGAGEVSWAGLLAGRGVVVVRHGALRTTYEPVTAQVVVGQRVGLGEPLGTLDAGHAGCPVSACLHWGLKRGEDYLDPLSLVGAGPVRLLPRLDGPGTAASPGDTGAAGTGGRTAPPTEPLDTAPALDLRSAASPSGLLALAALLAGLVLLTRPRPPASPAGAAASPAGAADEPGELVDDAPRAPVLDLERERLRRVAQR